MERKKEKEHIRIDPFLKETVCYKTWSCGQLTSANPCTIFSAKQNVNPKVFIIWHTEDLEQLTFRGCLGGKFEFINLQVKTPKGLFQRIVSGQSMRLLHSRKVLRHKFLANVQYESILLIHAYLNHFRFLKNPKRKPNWPCGWINMNIVWGSSHENLTLHVSKPQVCCFHPKWYSHQMRVRGRA